MSRGEVGDEEQARLAVLLVRHVLFKQQSHPFTPVKREELVELLQHQYPTQRGLLALILPRAQLMCQQCLGLEILDLGSARQGGAAQGDEEAGQGAAGSQASLLQSQLQSQSQSQLNAGKLYFLRSTLRPEVLVKHVLREDVAQQLGLRITVCALIQGAGGSLPEEALWRHMGRLGVRRDSTAHPAFGNVKECFQHMVKEKFIGLVKGHAEDGTETDCFELGALALGAIGEAAIQSYFEQICDSEEGR